MKAIRVAEIKVCATAGSALWNCQAEAALLALTEMRRVRLIHNDIEYIADPDKLCGAICRAQPMVVTPRGEDD